MRVRKSAGSRRRGEKTMPDRELMTCATGGCGWWGCVGVDKHSIQDLLERHEIREGCYNAGSHDGFPIKTARRKHWRWLGSDMRKGQLREAADDVDVERAIAKRLLDVIRVYYRRLI